MKKNIILPAGEYYIGDPCYLFDKSWNDILGVTDMFENDISNYHGHRFFVGNTAYGDGVYFDDKGRKYPIDSGLIGILSVSMIDIDNHIKKEEISEFGNLVVFENDFGCTIDNGYFLFGNIVIKTNDGWDEEEEDFWDYEDYDEDDDFWDDEEEDEYITAVTDPHDIDYANFEHNHEED